MKKQIITNINFLKTKTLARSSQKTKLKTDRAIPLKNKKKQQIHNIPVSYLSEDGF